MAVISAALAGPVGQLAGNCQGKFTSDVTQPPVSPDAWGGGIKCPLSSNDNDHRIVARLKNLFLLPLSFFLSKELELLLKEPRQGALFCSLYTFITLYLVEKEDINW